MRTRVAIGIGLLLGVFLDATATADARFPRPDALHPRVHFWTRVFAEVGTDGGLIHDSVHLDVVYEVLRLPEGLSPRSREERVESAKKRYQEILRHLASGRRSNLSHEELRVLALWPDGVSEETLRQASGRVRFQLGQADKFRHGLVRASAWEPHIRRVFAAEGIPQELAALPHVESSYNPRAVSKAGAAGMWQFTRPTGRIYLRIDSAVDERFDPWLSSEAAAALLRDNYERTGTWPLAITAYNHGTAGMRRAIQQVGTRNIETIIERYQSRSFGFASRNFYAEFLAALDVSRAAERYFGPLERAAPVDHEVVVLDAYYGARALSRAFGVDVGLLQELNPALQKPVWSGQKHVPRGYTLRLPRVTDRPPATTLLASLPNQQRFGEQKPDRHYRVRRGDTLSIIAHRFGVSEQELAQTNGLRNRHRIRVGQRLRVPGRPGTPEARRVPPARREPAPIVTAGTYRVQAGDALSTIASRLGVSEGELAAANDITRPDRIRAGQELRVPEAAAKRAPGVTAEKAPEAEPRTEIPGEQAAAAEPAAEEAAPGRRVAPGPAAATPGPETPSEPAAPPGATPDAGAADGSVPGDGAAEAPVAEPPGAPEPSPGAAPFDPSRYAVREDRILVQPEETLGHLADWLGVPTARLRRLNGLGPRTPLALGRRLKLDFSRTSQADFEKQRTAHHRAIREEFFRRHRVARTEDHVLRRGETLWELSRQRYGLPLWLLADYNPDLVAKDLRPGLRLRIPQVEPRST